MYSDYRDVCTLSHTHMNSHTHQTHTHTTAHACCGYTHGHTHTALIWNTRHSYEYAQSTTHTHHVYRHKHCMSTDTSTAWGYEHMCECMYEDMWECMYDRQCMCVSVCDCMHRSAAQLSTYEESYQMNTYVCETPQIHWAECMSTAWERSKRHRCEITRALDHDRTWSVQMWDQYWSWSRQKLIKREVDQYRSWSREITHP